MKHNNQSQPPAQVAEQLQRPVTDQDIDNMHRLMELNKQIGEIVEHGLAQGPEKTE
jgi:hypothetical protein